MFIFQTLLVKVNKQSTAQDLLESVCNKRQLDPLDHYVRITQSDTPPNTYIVLDPKDNIKNMVGFINFANFIIKPS